MRKIFFAIFILSALYSSGQTLIDSQHKYIPMTAYGYFEQRHKAGVQHIPVGDTSSLLTTDTSAQIRIFNSKIYYHYGYWREIASTSGGGSGGGISSVYAGDCLTKVNDSTLAFDPACAFDTSILRGVYMDTAYALNDSTLRFCKGTTCWDIRNGTQLITFEGDTITVNNITVKNKLGIPRTDTTHAKQGCGNLIYDTILEHYYGDVCINGVHDHWGCFDCASAGKFSIAGTNVSIDSTSTTYTINADDSDAYHTVTQLNDSTYTLNRPDGTKDTIQFTQGVTPTFYTGSNGITLSGSDFQWRGTLNQNTTINGAGFYSAFNGGRLEAGKGADVASANDLTLGSDGNTFGITGATQINAITTTNWQAGSTVSLVFASTPTVKNNTTGGAGTAKILLAGGVDYVAAANDVLTLLYDGTVWHETARKLASAGGQAALNAMQIGFGSVSNLLTGVDSLKYDATNRLITTTNSASGATFTANSSVTRSGLNALLLANNTPSTSVITGTASPAIVFRAEGWKSNTTAASYPSYGAINLVGVTGPSSAIGQMQFYISSGASQTAADPLAWRMSVDESGLLTANGSIKAGGTGGTGTFFGSTFDATTTNGTGVNITSSNSSGGKIHFKFSGQEVGKWFQSTGTFIIQNYGTIPADPADGTEFAAFQNGSYTGIGVVNNTSGTTAVTGTSTKFTNQYQAGDQIAFQGTGAETKTILSITDDTHLTLTANSTANHTNVAHTVTPATTKKFNLFQNGKLSMNGPIVFASTITAGGTTGNQTIDKPSGTVNIAAGGTAVTVTNSLVSASSIVYAVIRTNDATAQIKNVVPAAGSFTINIVASTGAVSIGFVVFNY